MKYLLFPYNPTNGVFKPVIADRLFGSVPLNIGKTNVLGVGVACPVVGNKEVTDVFVLLPAAINDQIRDLSKLLMLWRDGGSNPLIDDIELLDPRFKNWCLIGKTLLDCATVRLPDVRTFSTHVLEDEGSLIHLMNYNIF